MQQAPLPFAITRGAGHAIVYANAAFCRLAGIASGDALGSPFTSVLGSSEGQILNALLDRAFAERMELLDERVPAADESARFWRCSVWPVIANDGRVEAIGIEIRKEQPTDTALDLQRQVAEQMLLGALRERGFADDAEAARRRAAFLAESGRLLAESVDQSSTLVALTKLALPTLGSWCIVDILEGDAIQRLGIHHPVPERQKLPQQLQVTQAPEAEDPFGAPAMLRDARTMAIT